MLLTAPPWISFRVLHGITIRTTLNMKKVVRNVKTGWREMKSLHKNEQPNNHFQMFFKIIIRLLIAFQDRTMR